MQIEDYIQRHGNLLRIGRRRLWLCRVEILDGGRAVLHLAEGGRSRRAWLLGSRPFEAWALERSRGRLGPAFRVAGTRLEPVAVAGWSRA